MLWPKIISNQDPKWGLHRLHKNRIEFRSQCHNKVIFYKNYSLLAFDTIHTKY